MQVRLKEREWEAAVDLCERALAIESGETA